MATDKTTPPAAPPVTPAGTAAPASALHVSTAPPAGAPSPLSVEAAQAQVNVPAPPVIHPRDQLKQFVDSHFPQGSNRQLAADAFLAQLFAALDGLAALGLKFDLAEAEAAPKMEYPKLMYTGDGSVTREVSSKADEDKATADGYRTTPLPAAGPAPVQAPAQPGVAQPVHQ